MLSLLKIYIEMIQTRKYKTGSDTYFAG